MYGAFFPSGETYCSSIVTQLPKSAMTVNKDRQTPERLVVHFLLYSTGSFGDGHYKPD